MLQQIKDLAMQAGALFLHAASAEVTAKEGIGNFVTDYDVRAQKLIYEGLRKIHPEAALMGEEDAVHDTAVNSGECFIVDPLDGTQNFINGYRHSCVSIGMTRGGEPVLGVVYNPYQNELFWAEKGKGAFCNGKALHTSAAPLSESVFLFGCSSYNRAQTELSFRLLRELFDRSLDLRSSGSAALDMCYVAAGRVNLFFEYQLSPWDYCAGSVILREAGGLASQWSGEALDYCKGGSVLAAGANAYDEALSVAQCILRG